MTESQFRHLWIAAIVLVVIVIVATSLNPFPLLPHQAGADKFGHFFAYLVLAILATGIVAPERLWVAMLRCFLLGATLEVIQGVLTEERVAEWGDLVANTSGILIAWLIAGNGRAGWGYRIAGKLLRGQGP